MGYSRPQCRYVCVYICMYEYIWDTQGHSAGMYVCIYVCMSIYGIPKATVQACMCVYMYV